MNARLRTVTESPGLSGPQTFAVNQLSREGKPPCNRIARSACESRRPPGYNSTLSKTATVRVEPAAV